MKKSGGRFDLPIALGILVASRQVSAKKLGEFEYYGELALSGQVRSVPGVLPAAIKAAKADRPVVVPKNNGTEALLAGGKVFVVDNLLEVTALLNDGEIPSVTRKPIEPTTGRRSSRWSTWRA